MNKYIFLVVPFVLACSGSEPGPFGTGDDDGSGGDDTSSTGDDSTVNSSSTNVTTGSSSTTSAGGSSSTSSSVSTSSSGCTPTVTCASIGAECGTISDDGCGNSVSCANNCTGVMTCGGGGDQFKCGCTPQNPDNFPDGCGIVDDGCGNDLDLGECEDAPHVVCGGDGPPDNQGNPGTPGVANVCNGGCTYDSRIDPAIVCDDYNLPPIPYVCSTDSQDDPPFADCVFLPLDQFPRTWCCNELPEN